MSDALLDDFNGTLDVWFAQGGVLPTLPEPVCFLLCEGYAGGHLADIAADRSLAAYRTLAQQRGWDFTELLLYWQHPEEVEPNIETYLMLAGPGAPLLMVEAGMHRVYIRDPRTGQSVDVYLDVYVRAETPAPLPPAEVLLRRDRRGGMDVLHIPQDRLVSLNRGPTALDVARAVRLLAVMATGDPHGMYGLDMQNLVREVHREVSPPYVEDVNVLGRFPDRPGVVLGAVHNAMNNDPRW